MLYPLSAGGDLLDNFIADKFPEANMPKPIATIHTNACVIGFIPGNGGYHFTLSGPPMAGVGHPNDTFKSKFTYPSTSEAQAAAERLGKAMGFTVL